MRREGARRNAEAGLSAMLTSGNLQSKVPVPDPLMPFPSFRHFFSIKLQNGAKPLQMLRLTGRKDGDWRLKTQAPEESQEPHLANSVMP